MSVCKPSSSSLRYCCLQVSFLLFCQKCLSGRVSRRECFSCSKYSVRYFSSATFFSHFSPPSRTTTVTVQALHLLTVGSVLFPQDRLRRRLEDELSCACKVLFLIFVFPWLLCPYPLSHLDFFQWSSISVPDVFLFHLLPTANFLLCSQVAFPSYQGGDTLLQEAVVMMLYHQGKWTWVVVSNSARKQQRHGQMSPCCLRWEGIWVGRDWAAEGARSAGESNVWNLCSKIHQS